MPGSVDRRSELLASALEDGAGVPASDEQLRRELAMVSLLVAAGRDADQWARPDDAARERMRERILAGLAEPATVDAVVTPIGSAAGPAAARRRSVVAGVQGRLLVAAAAALCLLVTLSGMSLVLARDALPGDALYGVKRSAESAELGLTFGDEPRGFKHLQFATARVDEIEALAARADGAGSGADAGRYLTALQAFDTDAAAGSRLLIETATNGGGSELAALRTWAEQQRQRLGQAGAILPFRAAGRTAGSVVLLDRVIERVSALQVRLACLAVTSGTRDDVGLLPASGVCVPAAIGPGRPNTVSPSVTGTPVAPQPGLVFPGSPAGEQPGGGLGPLDPGAIVSTPSGPAGGPSQGTTSPGELPTASTDITVPLPLPLPEITVPPLLPGLPGLQVG